jgi:hypothetical protein
MTAGPTCQPSPRRAGPAWQRAVAVWLPRAAHLARALRRCRDAHSTPRARPTAPRRPDSLAHAARSPTASRRHLTAAVPTAAVRAASLGPQPAAPLPPPRRARCRRAAVAHRRLRAGEPPPPHRSVHVGRADAAAWAMRTVRLGRARTRPSCT